MRKKILTCLLLLFIVHLPAQAARVDLMTGLESVRPGQEFEVLVYLNTEEETVNAIEGRLIYSESEVEVTQINIEKSIVSLWAISPTKTADDQIDFAGIIPGGIKSPKTLLFSLTAKAKDKKIASFYFSEIELVRSDGLGSIAATKSQPLNLTIDSQSELREFQKPNRQDLDPPEPFEIFLMQDSAIYDGEYTIVFQTTDKISGIAYYEVSENGRKFERATSPHRLKNQDPDTEIRVRAIDREGNSRESTLNTKQSSGNTLFFGATLIAIIIISILTWRKRSKSSTA